MLQLGDYNELTAKRSTDNGWYLIDEEDNEVLLPNRYVPEGFKEEDALNVFLYKDSEDRIVATTDKPKVVVNEFACLQVKQVNKFGAFLDWGLEKDLMVPYSEQKNKMQEGESYVIRLVHDIKSDRLFASSKLNKFLVKDHITVETGEEVEVIIIEETELGFTAIIEDAHLGLLYHNETFKTLEVGDRLNVYVKKIREDGKIDLSLEKEGYIKVEPSAQKILEKLQENDGFLALHDKSHPVLIAETLEMSKKTFKKAIGTLYKQRLISLKENGIQLIKK
jgi:predicted RNA-binding protein (virulence factor B family)